jgi:hypothetical protein
MVFGVRAPIWVSMDLVVVSVYCDVFVCIRIKHCAHLARNYDINKV